jgi:uncharacterized protein (TIGR03083 family)
MELQPLLSNERRALADLLDELTSEEWEGPTVCAGWTVRHVVAHLVMPFRYSVPRFALNMIRAGGNFDRMADRVARKDGKLPTEELTAILRANADSPWTPPGAGFEAPLTDLAMHTLDICRPRGLQHARPAAVSTVVLDNLTSAQSQRHFALDLTGVELRATDVPWSYGTGALATGNSDDLILALGARAAGSDRLAGEGAASLVGRASAMR